VLIGRAQSDVLLNNLCESLNSKTVDGREKPIISCLEFLREYLMKRIVNVIRCQQTCEGPLTPRTTLILEENKEDAAQCTVKWNGGNKYQVSGQSREQYVVDVDKKDCSCRRWELTGIPCKHAVAVIWDMALNGQDVGLPESWVNSCYWLETWKEVYSYTIGPTNGVNMWPNSQCPTTLTPPLHRNPIGRPKKKRRKDQVELQDQLEKSGTQDQPTVQEQMQKNGKLSRKGKAVKCGVCKGKGHNSRTCKNKKKVGDQGDGTAGGEGVAA